MALKSGLFLPLDKDLNKFSHNHASYAARGALIVGACIASAGAKDAHTSFTVGATVRAVASIQLDAMPSVLHISALDVARHALDDQRAGYLKCLAAQFPLGGDGVVSKVLGVARQLPL